VYRRINQKERASRPEEESSSSQSPEVNIEKQKEALMPAAHLEKCVDPREIKYTRPALLNPSPFFLYVYNHSQCQQGRQAGKKKEMKRFFSGSEKKKDSSRIYTLMTKEDMGVERERDPLLSSSYTPKTHYVN